MFARVRISESLFLALYFLNTKEERRVPGDEPERNKAKGSESGRPGYCYCGEVSGI